MTERAQWHLFDSRAALAEALAAAVATRLAEALRRQESALLAVSGGSTPGAFFEALSRQAIDWGRVSVTLVDERQVPPDSERSNERLVRHHLLRDKAAAARFRRLDPASPPPPPDVVVLGMGTDGHTASIFADAPQAERLLDPDAPPAVMAVEALPGREARLTMTLALLIRARHVFVHIEGSNKKALLEGWLAGAERPPIAAVIAHAEPAVEIFWAPSGELP